MTRRRLFLTIPRTAVVAWRILERTDRSTNASFAAREAVMATDHGRVELGFAVERDGVVIQVAGEACAPRHHRAAECNAFAVDSVAPVDTRHMWQPR
jgi:hypothetical protein